MSKPYEIHPGSEGGFVVLEPFNFGSKGDRTACVAAFTSAADLIVWLAGQHGLRVEQLFPETTTRDVCDETSAILQSLELCKDEGCQHHGKDHVCTDWIKWTGGDRPVPPDTTVEVKFRNGNNSADVRAKIWSWTHRDDEYNGGDIIAYRLV